MKPYPSQEMLGLLGYGILKTYGLVYYACEERTGKSLSSIRCAELYGVDEVLVITKKKALPDWLALVKEYKTDLKITVSTYHQVQKLEDKRWPLVILDEAHGYLSTFPKPGAIWKTVKRIVYGSPIIYLSATPHAQGYHLLYHQFAISASSPFAKWKSFYNWHRHFGIEKTIWVSGREINQYDNTDEDLVRAYVDHLFITKTRAELGFDHEPEDVLHYVELGEAAKYVYNHLLKNKWVNLSVGRLVCDTASKLRYALHMVEGGTCKIGKDYHTLANAEKIQYINDKFGDRRDVVIMYQYIEEGKKLRKAFTNAEILQGTSNAEGVDLSHFKHLIIYSQDFSTAKHSQRRARQANHKRDEPIKVHYLLVKKGVSEQVYECVSKNKQNFVDSRFDKVKL
jgi:hypothetical protein